MNTNHACHLRCGSHLWFWLSMVGGHHSSWILPSPPHMLWQVALAHRVDRCPAGDLLGFHARRL